MFATALITFREVLEAALVIGIVLAASRGVKGRMPWLVGGLAVGLIGAVLVAVFAQAIGEAAEGMGQELFNAAILFAAVAMLGWHNVWMSRAGKAMAQDLTAMVAAVRNNERSVAVLATIVSLAILREGSEVVLFLYGIVAQGADKTGMITGSVIGLALGIAAGALIYFGLVRMAGRYLFAATALLILLLAAGMAAQGAKFLAQGGYLPDLGQRIWDTSAWIGDQDPVGTLLHALIGYTARPDGIQLVFYVLTLTVIGGLMYAMRGGKAPMRKVAAVAVLVGAFGVALSAPPSLAADLKVYSPIVEQGEFGFETRGNVAIDGDPGKGGAQTQVYEIEYTPTDFWHTALVGIVNKGAGGKLRYDATGWENIFQLVPQGKYWLDLGLYAEYETAHLKGGNDEVEFKLLAEKSFGPVTVTLNPIFEKALGYGAKATEVKYAAQVRWRLMPEFQPALEAFGDIGEIRNLDPPADQHHQIGPVALGAFRLGQRTALKYEAGYLFGLTRDGSPDGAFKWLLELEYRF